MKLLSRKGVYPFDFVQNLKSSVFEKELPPNS